MKLHDALVIGSVFSLLTTVLGQKIGCFVDYGRESIFDISPGFDVSTLSGSACAEACGRNRDIYAAYSPEICLCANSDYKENTTECTNSTMEVYRSLIEINTDDVEYSPPSGISGKMLIGTRYSFTLSGNLEYPSIIGFKQRFGDLEPWEFLPDGKNESSNTFLIPGSHNAEMNMFNKAAFNEYGSTSTEIYATEEVVDSGITLDCPSRWATDANCTCSLQSAGYNVEATVDFGDSTPIQTVYFNDFPYTSVGRPAGPETENYVSAPAGNVFILEGAVENGGTLERIEFQGVSTGTIKILIIDSSLNVIKISSGITVVVGFQTYVFPTMINITEGQRIGFYASANNLIACRNTSIHTLPDTATGGTTEPAIGETFTPTNTTVQHLIRASIRPTNMVYITYVYSSVATVTFSVSLQNNRTLGPSYTKSKSIEIIQGMNDTWFDMPLFAPLKEPYSITMTPNSGSDVKYDYTFGDGQSLNESTSKTTQHTYDENGVYNLSVKAYTEFDERENNTEIAVIERLNFTEILAPTAVRGNETYINLTIVSGSNYTCNWTIESVGSFTTDTGNVTYNLIAGTGGIHNVTVTCYNGLGSITRSTLWRVEEIIKGVKITPVAALKGQSFYIFFEYSEGTYVTSELMYNSVIKPSVVFESTKKGQSNHTITEATISTQVVSVKLTNMISEVIEVCNFSINTAIENPTLMVDRFVQVNESTSLVVKADGGSSAKVTVYFGDGQNSSQEVAPATEFPTAGLTFNHVYDSPNEYTPFANLDNIVSQKNVTNTILILTEIGNYSCQPLHEYYKVNHPALFNFTRISGDKAVASNISINWGDSPNWEMLIFSSSFVYNHTYSSPDVYNVTVRIHNPIPSQSTCQVYIGVEIPISSLTCIVTPPNVITSSPFTTKVKFSAGSNVNITYDDGTNAHIKTVEIANSNTEVDFPPQTFTTAKAVPVNVTACNNVGCQSCLHMAFVQNGIPTDLAFNPVTTQISKGESIDINLVWTGPPPTNATGNISVSDGSAASNQSVGTSSPSQLSRVMSKAGRFNITITVSNLVDKRSTTIEIYSFEPFADVNLTIFYVEDGSTEEKGGFGPDKNRYPSFKPVYFRTTTTAGWALWYKFSYEWKDNGTVHCCNHSGLDTNVFNHTFNEVGNYQVYVMLWTPFYNFTTSKNISIGGALQNLKGWLITTNWSPKRLGLIGLSWTTLTLDACICAYFGDGQTMQLYMGSTPPINCTWCNKGLLRKPSSFNITYMMEIPYIYHDSGTYEFSLFVYTTDSNFTYNVSIPVSQFRCSPAKVIMTNKNCYGSKKEPISVVKSAYLNIGAEVTEIPCEVTYENTKQWNISELNDDLTFKSEVSLGNIVSTLTTLELPPNWLQIGLYLFEFHVTLNKEKTVYTYENTTSCYIQVVPSTLRIQLTKGGMNSVTRGVLQNICLDPAKFSYDPDDPSSGSQGIGNWTWYCYAENENEPNMSSPLIKPYNEGDAEIQDKEPPTINGCFRTGPGRIDTNAGSFCFWGGNMVANHKYFVIVTATKGLRKAETKLTLNMTAGEPPVIEVACLRESVCPKRTGGVITTQEIVVNPTGTLQVSATCIGAACYPANYLWRLQITNGGDKWDPLFNDSFAESKIQGLNTKGIAISPLLYKYAPETQRFRACFFAGSEPNVGSSCLQFFVNPPPEVGKCVVNGSERTSIEVTMGTLLIIQCSGFSDSNGIKSYFYFMNKLNPSPVQTKSNAEAIYLKVPLFTGTQEVCVNVTDNEEAVTQFCFANITVKQPTQDELNKEVEKVLSESEDINRTLAKGNLDETTNMIKRISNVFKNETKTIISPDALDEGEKQAAVDKTKVLGMCAEALATTTNADTFSSVMMINSAVLDIAENNQLVARDAQRNLARATRDTAKTLKTFVNSGKSKEMIQEACVMVTRAIEKTMETSISQMDSANVEDYDKCKDAVYETALFSKQAGSMGSYADTESNFNNFICGERQATNTRGIQQDSAFSAMSDVEGVILDTQLPGETFNINLQSAELKILSASNASDFSNKIFETTEGASVKMGDICQDHPNFCLLETGLSMTVRKYNPIPTYVDVTKRNKGPALIPLSETFTIRMTPKNNKKIDYRTSSENALQISIPNAVPSKNEAFTKGNLSFGEPVPEPGTGDIGKPPTLIYRFLMVYNTSVEGIDQSFSFEMKFTNCTAFLVIFKFGYAPDLNKNDQTGYIQFLIPAKKKYNKYCPEYDANATPKNPFTAFINNEVYSEYKLKLYNETGDWQTELRNMIFVGVRELVPDEYVQYQSGEAIPFPYPYHQLSIYTNYSFRQFSKSCQSIQEDTPGASWTPSGCTVMPETTISKIMCKCSHLTTFAGGWITPPNTIDFSYVFANMDFTKNVTLYATVITIFVIYIFIMIWARRADKKDLEKLGVSPLPDNDPNDMYLYEIIVETGIRTGAGCDSNVFFILSGEYDETDVRQLADEKRKILRRGATNRFLLACPRPLGNLQYARLWHDNSGKGNMAGWYCGYFGVVDLQSRQRYHFMVSSWFAVEEEDGLVDRLIPVAGADEMTKFAEMFGRKTKQDFSDGHLWISVMARPPESRFTRTERVSVCLLLLYLTMLATCMFYKQKGSASVNGFVIGPFKITPNEGFVALVTNLITFVPIFIIMQLFRTSALYHGHANSLKEAVEKHLQRDKRQLDSRAMLYRQQTNEQVEGERPQTTSSNANLIPNEAPPPYSSQDRLQEQWSRSLDQVSVHMSRAPMTQESLHFHGIVEEETIEKEIQIERKKKKRLFPWGVRVVAWIILVIGVIIGAAFTIFYGIMFGNEACQQWISAMFMSFFMSVLLTQPLKVVLLAIVISIMFKKKGLLDDDEYENEEDIIMNELGKKYGLRTDEEWLHQQNLTSPIKPRKIRYDPPSEEDLERAREYRLQELHMYDVIREIIFYLIFYFLLLSVTYTFRDQHAYELKAEMERLYVAKGSGYSFDTIRTEEQFWNWTEFVFIPGIRAANWYNNDRPFFQRGFTGDRTGRMMGYAILRQLRVPPGGCAVNPPFKDIIGVCERLYSFYNSDTTTYGVSWVPFEKNATHNNSEPAYTFRTSESLEGQIFIGQIHTYGGEGYVQEMIGNVEKLKVIVNNLKKTHWIDAYTRAIFIQFTVYNPFVNLFGVATMLLELPGTGGFWSSYRFEPANLLSFLSSSNKAYEVACIVGYFICIFIFMVKEGRKMYFQRKAYFTIMWNWVEIFIIGCSFGSVAAYAYMIIETNRLTAIFEKYHGNVYTNFQFVAYWHEHLMYVTSFIVFISTVKFIRLLRFNKRMGMLGSVLAYSANDIQQFNIMFGIIFLAFVQLFYLLFKNGLYRYHTFIHALESMMQIALGKFEFLQLYEMEPILGPLVFAAFVIFIIFIMLNMFMAILNQAFEKVRSDLELQSNEYELVEFIMKRFFLWTGMNQTKVGRKIFKEEITESTYVEANSRELTNKINDFPDKVDQLIGYIDKVYLPNELPPELRKQKEKEQRKQVSQHEIAMVNRCRRTVDPDSDESHVQNLPPVAANDSIEERNILIIGSSTSLQNRGIPMTSPQPPRPMSSTSVRSELTPVNDLTTEL